MTVTVVERHQPNDFVAPAANTDHLNNSNCVKTIDEWNKLSEPLVRAGKIGEFSRLSCGLHSQ